ncbi:sugar phosphate isomerase/epimerase family protein [Azospirillum doebereinerae]|uniref:Sugar phosphate isomerase/epimerase n=1 Tax=Azospirillum doebereinerae TaxID=92933 RepID=A0A3S0X6Y7_9PROT|nr:sugar phosphate isomerase/epimerase [Azospirillum doebereinerae]MCG5240617.1 sugar phosphate isomerase/epimerase [Azospirillum doebereinerae]RUQ62017.1 sugar phosphate isomerase/epimerase [Azospirillum doebereinerae]
MNPLSLSYYTVPELSPPDMVSVAAEAGCAHVGLRLLGGQPDGEPMPLLADPSLRREMKRRMADTGVTALDANTARVLPHTDLDAFRPFLEVAAELGARHALATGDDPDPGRLAARLGRLCDDAAGFGLTVQFEFVSWMSVPSVTAAAALLDRIDRPSMGIALDALHYHRSGGTPADVAAVEPARFAYMHLCDAPAAYADDRDSLLHVAVKERLFPGEGGIDLAGLLRALPPGLPLALEIPTATLARSVDAPARVARAVAATRRLLATL